MEREIKDASSSSGASGSSSEEEKLSDASNHPEQQRTKETLNAEKEEDSSSEETVNGEKEEEDDSSDEVSSSEEEKVTKNSDPGTEKDEEGSSEESEDDDEDGDEEKEIAPKETESETSSELQPKQTDFILAFKRPADIIEIGETSKLKKARVTENREGKKSPFGRVFSEQDELVLLKQMVKYYTERSIDPSTDIGGFYNSVKNLLQVRVTKLQVSEKVRRMKQRYFNSAGKEVGDSVSTYARKLEIFRLGEQIWGNLSVNGADSGGKSKKTKSSKGGTILNEEIQRLDDEPVLSKDEFFSRYPQIIRLLSNEHSFMKKNVHLIGSQKAKELDEELNKLFVREIEIFSKKTMLAAELAKALLDVTK